MPAKMETQLVKTALPGAITDQECQGPWQAAQYHRRQALLREAFESQLRGVTRLIAHRMGHNAFLAD